MLIASLSSCVSFLASSTLHLTCGDVNNVELLELLLTCDVIIDVQNDQGQTALHIACEANAPFLAAILIAKGKWKWLCVAASLGQCQ